MSGQGTARDDRLATVAFISPKGGAGKTTAALLLALGLNERGRKVAIIDSDPNKPLVHWGELPGKPQGISIHPAPSMHDVPAALREARRKDPDWVILDTEGSIRGALAFTALRLDMVITPLAGSQLEADQALVASELVRQHGVRAGHPLLHRALLTRVPAALRPRNLKNVVDQLHERGMELLPIALIEKEAFRAIFAVGGGLGGLEDDHVAGVPAARANAHAYVDAVLETLAAKVA
jgi:chromosome partitioning protein